MNTKSHFMQADKIGALIERMSGELRELVRNRGLASPVMIGIHTGGAWIAERLHSLLQLDAPLGTLDISFYRDDYTRVGVNPVVRPSNLPFDVDDRHIILVDDVLHTGRTIRAAMNELFDYGRPASIILAVLLERSGRELPIAADIVGLHPALEPGQHLTLTGPEPLGLIVGRDPNRVSRERGPSSSGQG